MNPRETMRVLVALALLVAPRVLAQNVERLSLKEAEDRAVRNHPQIRAGQYEVLAAGETVRQVKSAYFPTVFGSFTGAQAHDGTRITAGGLNNPIILDRFAYGVSASQMLTDFGRTSTLAASAVLRVDSQLSEPVGAAGPGTEGAETDARSSVSRAV